jgi:peptidoglycan/LPS O-acetylase OafA/YrhL
VRRSTTRQDVQGLRGVAVAMVVAEHARLALPGGFTGVDVFFVISGFVITTVLLRDLDNGTFGFRRFWSRRARRLLPAAAVVLVSTAVGTAFLLSPFGTQQQAGGTGAAAALGLGNVALYAISADYFSEHVQLNPYLHTWSLGVEEQYYLVFPVLVLVAFRLGRSRRGVLAWMLLGVVLVSFALSAIVSSSAVLPGISSPAQFSFYMPVTRAWEFAVGALVAVATSRSVQQHRPGGLPARWATLATAAGLTAIAVSALTITEGVPWPGSLAALPVLGTALVLWGGARPNPVSAALSVLPLRRLGDVSYSLYLWHWPLLVFARRLWPNDPRAVVVAIGAALALAVLTTRYVETPFRAGSGPPSWRELRAPAVSVLAGMTTSAIVLGGSLVSWWSPPVRAAADQLLARPAGYDTCLSTVPVSERDLRPCTWGDPHGEPIYLLGDSNAQQFTEAVRSAAEASGRRVVVATWGGCPFVDVGLRRITDPLKGQECRRYVADTTAWLATQERGTVVLAASSEMVLGPDDAFTGPDETMLRRPREKAALWGDRLAARITGLASAGFDVVLVRTPPHFLGGPRDFWHPVQCQDRVVFTDPAGCAVSVPLTAVERRQRLIRQAEQRALDATGVRQVDITDDVCRDGVCTTFRAGTWLYRDGLHIAPGFSAELASRFEPVLAAR